MPRLSRTALLLVLAGLAAGVGLGLYVGWVAAPVQYVDTAPDSLQRSFKDDYVLMIASAYGGDGNLAAARAQLAGLGFNDPAAAVSAANQRLSAAGLPNADQQRLAALARALAAPATSSGSSTP
jgi:hypothetical protein